MQTLIKSLSPFMLLCLFSAASLAQHCEELWASFDQNYVSSSGSSSIALGRDMVLDASGNPYSAFYQSFTGEAGVAKFNGVTGEVLWEQLFCAAGGCHKYLPTAIEVDGSGNVFVAGYERVSAGNSFGIGIWLRKYDTNGNLLWAQFRSKDMGNTTGSNFTINTRPEVFLKLDAAGNVYTVGRDYNVTYGFPYQKYFIEKYNGSGISQWSASSPQINGAPSAIDITAGGDVAICGGASNTEYITVYDTNGNLSWDYFDNPNSVNATAVKFHTGNTLRVLTETTGPTTSHDVAIMTFSNTGNLNATTSYQVSGYQTTANLLIDGAGNNIILGQMVQTSGSPYVDWFVLKGEANGTVTWSVQYNGDTNNDEFVSAWPRGLGLDASGNVFAAGMGGPTYINGTFNTQSALVQKFSSSDGSALCMQADQTGMGPGGVVLPSGSNFFGLFHSRRRIVKYGSGTQTGVNADLKIFLKGAYGTPTFARFMKTDLRPYLPLAQPYNIAPWNYTGTESVGTMPGSVVDWVLVEARTGTAANTAYEQKVGLLHSHGLITGPLGTSLHFSSPPTGSSVYLVIYHRNHLSMMSATAISENTGGKFRNDFSLSAQVFGGISAGVTVNSGVLAMVSGDANGDGDVNAIDQNSIWLPSNGNFGDYFPADMNLDGDINATDSNLFWKPFNGRFTYVPQ